MGDMSANVLSFLKSLAVADIDGHWRTITLTDNYENFSHKIWIQYFRLIYQGILLNVGPEDSSN